MKALKRAKFHLYQSGGKRLKSYPSARTYWWFTVVGRNGRVLVVSETYRTRAGAMNGMGALVREGLRLAVVEP